MCLLTALQAFCEEWVPLRKRLALKGRVDDDVPDPHPSVLHDLAKRCVVAGLQRKVSRQACDPLALCSGSLPSWCVRLPAEFPTLFSLETRLALYKKTSLGMARVVSHIQNKAKRRTPLPELLRQLGRLGRLTVLLCRDSIPEMATFLFELLVNGQEQPPHQQSIQPEMEFDEDALSDAEEPDPGHEYGVPQQAQQPQSPLPSEAGDGNAGRGEDRRVVTVEASVPPPHAGRQTENRADIERMLLVEFDGETGHGTEPTLEFYSLVCRELTRKGHGMWRGDDVSRSPPQGAANSSTVSVGQKEGSETSPTLEGLDDSEVGESEGKGSATRGVDGGDGPGAFSQQDDMAVEEDDPFLQVGP
ncbi:unnamed protein product, partial [Ascophyllum nodosum]